MLTKSLEKRFDFKGMSIELDIPFNHILLVYELLEDDTFEEIEKIEMIFNLICRCKNKKIDVQTKNEIVQHIFKNYINVVNVKSNKSGAKHYDFNNDAGFIYASFMSDYNIDLYEKINSLDWRKFIWLFHGLSKDSKMKEVINIRSMKIPKQTKTNGEYIQNILEMKDAYQLKLTAEQREKKLAESLKSFARKYINF